SFRGPRGGGKPRGPGAGEPGKPREKGREPVSEGSARDVPAKGARRRGAGGSRGYLHGDGVLHRLDPRVKVTAAIVLLVAILGIDTWAGYAAMAGVVVVAAALGKIPGMRLVKAVQGVGFLLF